MFVILTTRPSGAMSLHSRLYKTFDEAVLGAMELPKADENRVAVHRVESGPLFIRKEVTWSDSKPQEPR